MICILHGTVTVLIIGALNIHPANNAFILDLFLHLPRRICNRRCLSVCLSASNIAQKLLNEMHETFRKGWQWANEQTIKFWWRSDSRSWIRTRIPIRIRIRIATLVRRALADVCTVPMLLVRHIQIWKLNLSKPRLFSAPDSQLIMECPAKLGVASNKS